MASIKNPKSVRLQELLQSPGNEGCADCRAKDPVWASYNIGVFICENCCGIHRSLGTHVSKIKSVHLDNWDDEQIKAMADMGNAKARTIYEKDVPACYRKPSYNDAQVLKEQWIIAKYVRKEFMDPAKQTYLSGTKEGIIFKKGKKDGKFLPRKFKLSESNNTLEYYILQEDQKKGDKLRGTIDLDKLNCNFAPEKIGHSNGMQITYEDEGSTRNLFLYTEEGKDIVDWYTAIRCAKLNRYRVAHPSRDDQYLVDLLDSDFKKEGWMWKTGPQKNHGYKKRWFILENRKLMYYEEPMYPYPKGEIFIGHKEQGYSVREGIPEGRPTMGFGFTLTVPDRDFVLSTQTKREADEWLEALDATMSQAMSPQDNKAEISLVRKRTASGLGILNLKIK